MKATKVLGIVLGALLVAALFTGAAVADNEWSLGDVTVYKLYGNGSGDLFPGINATNNLTWTGDAGSVTFLEEENWYYIGGDGVVPGKYYKYIGDKNYTINVKHPTATVTGQVLDGNAAIAQLIGSTVETNKAIVFNGDNILAFTNPDGSLTATNLTAFGADENDAPGKYNYTIKALDLGTWTVRAVFQKGTVAGAGNYSTLAPDYMYGKEYYFTVVKEKTDTSISTVDTEIVQGGFAKIVLEAPKGTWFVTVDKNGEISTDQPSISQNATYNGDSCVKVEVPVSGVVTFSVKALTTSNIKVTLYDNNNGVPKTPSEDSLTIKVKAGAITAGAEVASVFIGDEVDISGTNDLGGNLYFYIKGTNYKFAWLNNSITGMLANGKEWTETLDTADLTKIYAKRPDAGTYTIYVVSMAKDVDPKNITDVNMLDNTSKVQAYSTVSLALKQPFLTITSAPEVVTHGDDLVVKGTAEGNPSNVRFYIFGTNKFVPGIEAVESDGTFEISKKIHAPDKAGEGDIELAAGQYFLVIQHPMYDGVYNIGPVKLANGGYDIVLYEEGSFENRDNKTIFNTNERQSANAAQALCDALDSQNIDDMYVKASFIVAGATSYIDPVPSQVTKGQVLTISGTTTGHKDEVVTVELLSTAFAAIPKEAVGSASFVALTTKIGDDGVWSISFDTSNLNADEYTCSVAVGQLDATSSKITIVEGTNPQPTQTAGPVTPTAQPTATPATPGFGALAALAGLGAVAVLLLRRQ